MASRTVPLSTTAWTLLSDADEFWAERDGDNAAHVTWAAIAPVSAIQDTPKHRVGGHESVTRNGLTDNLYGIGSGSFTVSE